MQYHSMKVGLVNDAVHLQLIRRVLSVAARLLRVQVEEINKIIRELWTRTYRGNDIEDISIVSGEDAAGGGGRAAKSYNYR